MTWSSQPRLSKHGVYAGDFLLAVNTLLSGNNFQKVALLNKFMNIGMVHKTAFHDICMKYAAPQIEKMWKLEQEKSVSSLRSKEVTVIGDGRMDSPGHCAQYCTYTLMDYETKCILSTVIIDKRETKRKSTNMEREGLIRALKEVQDMGLVVKELVTDGHPGIAKMISKYVLPNCHYTGCFNTYTSLPVQHNNVFAI